MIEFRRTKPARSLYIFIFLAFMFLYPAAECQETNKGGVKVYDFPSVLGTDHPDYLALFLKHEASVKASMYPLPGTPDDWKIYRSSLKAEIIRRTGALLSQKIPLNMRETGSTGKTGYSVRNIVFQTRPGIYATANLYVPDGDGKFPGVVVMMGHSSNGRFYGSYQAVGASLALHGYVSLCIDPWGSGERTTIHGRFEDHGDENNLGSSLLNIGETLMGMEITDNVRAVDLLCSLPYVDSKNIGATGSSGGGNQTMWLAAMDERVKAAVPVVSAGTFEAYMLGSPCICEVLPGGLDFTEESGIISLIAPRAVKMINHQRDDISAFLPREMMRTFKAAQPVFKMYEAENNIAYQTFDLPHGYFPEDREVMLGWFDMHLKKTGNGDPVKGIQADTIPYKQLMTFPAGKRDTSVITIANFCKQKGNELRSLYLKSHSIDNELKRKELTSLLGITEKSTLAGIHEYPEMNGWKRFALETSDGKVLTVLVRLPEKKTDNYVIICNTSGIKRTSRVLIDEYLVAGCTVVLPDLSGTGETTSFLSHINDNNGNFRTLARSEFWLGKTLIGEWVNDLGTLVYFLKERYDAKEVSIDGTREAGLAALFLAALNGNISNLRLRDIPVSYVFDTRENVDFYSMAIHIPGFLKWGDISLASALSGADITFIDPLTISGRKLSGEKLDEFKSEFEQIKAKCGTRGLTSFH